MRSKPSMASGIVIPNRPEPSGCSVAEIYIGGAADGQSRIVASFVKARQRLLLEGGNSHGRTAAWFAHYDVDGATSHCMAALSRGDDIALVGHSWGSDAALRVAHQLNGTIGLLAGVDPVMRPGSVFSRASRRPENAALIVHVDASPRQLDRSDIVKATGVVLGGGVAGAYRSADIMIRTDLNHWAFADMMAAPGLDGVSLNDRIGKADWRAPIIRAG
ncbi:MAG: pimeloyl-ACP methyl ester carboxylesterase [Hyphomonas sp.]|jgi:pimeloyl-ACP methyl ester carboxylesterase